MSDAKPTSEEMLRRLSEVLDVLKKITEDLQDISKSLKTASPRATATPAAEPSAAKPSEKRVEDVRMMFAKDLEALLIFEDKGAFIWIKPRQFLGSENFAKIASAVREAGGEYISAGKESHFRIPK